MKASDSDMAQIERFLDALWLERGLSENTLAAYRSDLQHTAYWLNGQGRDLLSAGRGELLEYLHRRTESGARPRSTARLLSSLRLKQ
ncbi:MAG: site-specific integrase [Nitrosomonas halophila]